MNNCFGEGILHSYLVIIEKLQSKYSYSFFIRNVVLVIATGCFGTNADDAWHTHIIELLRI